MATTNDRNFEYKQQVSSLIAVKEEFDKLTKQYNVPDGIRFTFNQRWWHDLPEDISAVRGQFIDGLEEKYGSKNARRVMESLHDLYNLIGSYRYHIRNCSKPSFIQRKQAHLHKTECAATEAFCFNGGDIFDFHIAVNFLDREMFKEQSIKVLKYDYFYRGGNSLKSYTCRAELSPKYLKTVLPHFRFFINKGEKCWVYEAETIDGHAFNDYGYRVFKAKCFGLNADKEPTSYELYIVDAPSYQDGDGNVIFAHGIDPNSALNLLKRRIKSETLKRLSI